MIESRNDRRKRKYNLLVKAGFNAKDATKYKDLHNWTVIKLIEAREELSDALDVEYLEFDRIVREILAGGSK